MAETKQKVTYKRFNGTDWDTIYFTTSATSVLESTDRRFLNPSSHTVNGKSFFNGSNAAQGITLTAADIGATFAGSTIVTAIGAATDVATALTELVEGVEAIQSQINGLTGGGVVTGITTPTLTDAKGLVDLSADFANYLPLTGGTLTGALTVQGTITGPGGSTISATGFSGANGTFGTLNITSSATIANLTVTGTTTTVNATNLEISDNLITVAKGNTVALANPAGLLVPKYDGTNYGALYFDSTGTAYVGDVSLNSSGQIDTSSSSTTALPLALRSKTAPTSGNLALWRIDTDTNSVYLDSTDYSVVAAISDRTTDTQIPTYGAMKTKVAGSLSFANNILTLLALDGSTTLGTATLGAASAKAVDTSIAYTSSSANLPTVSAVNTFVKNYSNRTFYASTTPTDARTGDLWFDTAGSSTVA